MTTTIRQLLFVFLAVTMSLVLISELPMKAGAVAAAQQSAFDVFKTKLTTAVEMRLSESREVSSTIEEATYLPADLKKDIEADNKANTAALTTIKSDLEKSKTTSDLQGTAQKLDAQYEQSQFNVQQGAVINDLNTQQDAAKQLQSMVDQANSLIQQCKDEANEASANHDHDQQGAAGQNCSSVSGSSGNSGSGGQIDVQSIITTVVQLLAAVAAIVASIIALIMAIQSGDYTAALTIFTTILGQLETIAGILSDAISQMSEAIQGLGGSTSGGGSGSGDESGGTSDSKDLLPVGDGKYTTSGPKKGYVYTCERYAKNLQQGRGGAEKRGPWFVNNNKDYDPTKKVYVKGSVRWNGSFYNKISGSTREITTNNVPSIHSTGEFPIGTNDPAYKYDRNPNNIQEQTISYKLATNPAYGSPQCVGHQVGIMMSGVILFNALDERGRDAGAWETQDTCEGHPENTHKYHYHTLSNCVSYVGAQTVVGFALDGFPITGPKKESGEYMTDDLDECHGTTSEINIDGQKRNMYHYVMTKDFPYSVSCFRSTAVPPTGV